MPDKRTLKGIEADRKCLKQEKELLKMNIGQARDGETYSHAGNVAQLLVDYDKVKNELKKEKPGKIN